NGDQHLRRPFQLEVGLRVVNAFGRLLAHRNEAALALHLVHAGARLSREPRRPRARPFRGEVLGARARRVASEGTCDADGFGTAMQSGGAIDDARARVGPGPLLPQVDELGARTPADRAGIAQRLLHERAPTLAQAGRSVAKL